MQKANEADNSDENDGMDIPEEINRREDRIAVIKEAKEKIEQQSKERYEKEKNLYDKKMTKCKEKEKLTGKKTKGKTPKQPTKEIKGKDQINLTEEESCIMKTSGGGFEQCCNAQASVEHDSRLIVHQHVTQNGNDKLEISPTFKWFEKYPGFKPPLIVADAGYFSEDNIKLCEEKSITPYISFGKEQHDQPLKERFKEADPLPPDPTSVEKAKHRLQTKEGKAIYSELISTVEPVFGVTKDVIGFRQFMLEALNRQKENGI